MLTRSFLAAGLQRCPRWTCPKWSLPLTLGQPPAEDNGNFQLGWKHCSSHPAPGKADTTPSLPAPGREETQAGCVEAVWTQRGPGTGDTEKMEGPGRQLAPRTKLPPLRHLCSACIPDPQNPGQTKTSFESGCVAVTGDRSKSDGDE